MLTSTTVRIWVKRFIVICLIATAYWFSKLPKVTDPESLITDINIERIEIPLELDPDVVSELQYRREVHPKIKRIAKWIASVGNSASLVDLNNDGLTNELVLVEPRTDQVIIYTLDTNNGKTDVRWTQEVLETSDVSMGAIVNGHKVPFAAAGAMPGDFNEDGLFDILVFYMGRSPVIYYQKERDINSSKIPPLTAENFVKTDLIDNPTVWNSNASILTDLDGDNHADLIVGNYALDMHQYLDPNDADKGGRGPLPKMPDSMSMAFNGGTNHVFQWSGLKSVGSNLNKANFVEASLSIQRYSDGKYEDISKEEEDRFNKGWTLAIGSMDLNGDLLPELYFANDFGPDYLLLNQSKKGEFSFLILHGERDWLTPKSKVLGYDSFKGMGVDFSDLNKDGIPDIIVSNMSVEFAFEESHFVWMSTGDTDIMKKGIAPYKDKSEPMGLSRSHWAWDVKFADLDNNGIEEVIQATGFVKGKNERWARFSELLMGNDAIIKFANIWPNLTFGGEDGLGGDGVNAIFMKSNHDGRYYDLSGHLDFMKGYQDLSRGIAVGDIDEDGDLDFVFSNQWEPSYFFHNKLNQSEDFDKNHKYLLMRIWLTESNNSTPSIYSEKKSFRERLAIGAIVKVFGINKDTNQAEYICIDQVDGGIGHTGNNTDQIHVGLGKFHDRYSELEVHFGWIDGLTGNNRKYVSKMQPGSYKVLLPITPVSESKFARN